MEHVKEHFAVVGGGLVGSLWALMAARRGHRVDIFERREDPRKGRALGGRSINLALSDRGWRALEKAGMVDRVREIAMPIQGRLMHAVDGTTTFQPYGRADVPGVLGDGQCIYSVSRAGLNRLLVEAAEEHADVSVHFGHKCTDVDLRSRDAVHLTFEAEGKAIAVEADRVFGTDGAFSAVRDRMMRTDRFDFEQRYLAHGYKEIEMKAMADGGFQMREDALHIWPRGNFMLMALPNPNGTFTCTLFAPYEGHAECFENWDSDEAVQGLFERQFPDVLPLLPNLLEDWNDHPTASLVMVRCEPWHRGERVCLMGDAAHAIVPFYGQGMNSGMEDCTVLDDLLDSAPDWGAALSEYTRLRKPDGDAILELALRNYVEMRDLTGDPRFLLQKKIEARLQRLYPDEWLPLYSQVTFSHTRYHEALAAGKAQDAIMREVMDRPDIAEVWDSEEVAEAAMMRLRALQHA